MSVDARADRCARSHAIIGALPTRLGGRLTIHALRPSPSLGLWDSLCCETCTPPPCCPHLYSVGREHACVRNRPKDPLCSVQPGIALLETSRLAAPSCCAAVRASLSLGQAADAHRDGCSMLVGKSRRQRAGRERGGRGDGDCQHRVLPHADGRRESGADGGGDPRCASAYLRPRGK